MYRLIFTAFLLLSIELDLGYAAAASINQLFWNSPYQAGKQRDGCASLCCEGKNATCFSHGISMSGTGGNNDLCYCDAGCLDLGDCCEDYSLHCQPIDCQVGEWEKYGECTKECGRGEQTRSREVSQEPRNGGNECPTLKETRSCYGKRCKAQRHILTRSKSRSYEDAARIMPATYAKFRSIKSYNPSQDIRKNLWFRYYFLQDQDKKQYCAYYKITSTRIGCFYEGAPFYAKNLKRDATVCVECQKHAMDTNRCTGDGALDRETFWTAVNAAGCHGYWMRTTELSECTCGKGSLDYIFV